MRRWREASANVLYECDWMIVLCECYKNIKINKKEWHTATKPLTFLREEIGVELQKRG
jgi:hypothetical protein